MNTPAFKKHHFPIVRNESGVVLVMALLTITLLSLLGKAALTNTEIEIKISANDRVAKETFHIAEAGIEHARTLLRTRSFDDVLEGDDDDKNEPGDNGQLLSNVSFGNGSYDVHVTDNKDGDDDRWDDKDGTIIVTSTGSSSNGPKRVLEIVVTRITLIPTGLRGAVTSNGSIVTDGDMQIDGRDHDMDGNVIATCGCGTLGISTTSILTQDGSSDIGGTFSGTDYAPSDPFGPGIPFIIEENAAWIPPATPEDVLGLTVVDQLKTLAQSGIKGSKYVTDPSELTFPLSGITYVELPDGATWNARSGERSVDFEGSTGILIVHNEMTNAGLEKTSTGTFRGIVIADKYDKIDNTIIGAVVTLASDSRQIGDGDGEIRYSQEGVDSALASGSIEFTTESWREKF